MTNKWIGFRKLGKPDNQQQNNTDQTLSIKAVSDEEYTKCINVIKKLSNLHNRILLLKIVEWNYFDYNYIIIKYRNDTDNELAKLLYTKTLIIDINHIILNLLSSITMFMNNIEMHIKREFNEDSVEWQEFKTMRSKLYDNSFSYRLLYQLRNYTQHCVSPVDAFTVNSRVNPDNNEISHEFSFGLYRDKALSVFDWKSLKTDLMKQPAIIDIDSHIHLMMKAFKDMHVELIKSELRRLHTDAEYVDRLAEITHCSDKYLEFALFEYDPDIIVKTRSNTNNMKYIPFPMDILFAALKEDIEQIGIINVFDLSKDKPLMT